MEHGPYYGGQDAGQDSEPNGRADYVPRPPGVPTRSPDIVSQMMMEVMTWNASWAPGGGGGDRQLACVSGTPKGLPVHLSQPVPTTNKEGRGFYLPTQD